MKGIANLEIFLALSFFVAASGLLDVQDRHENKGQSQQKLPALLPTEIKSQDWTKIHRKNSRNSTKKFHFDLENRGEKELCLSKNCVTSAAKILEYMDPSIDPCQDFYGFVCGSYQENTILAEGQSRQYVMGDMGKNNAYQIHRALSVPYNPLVAPKDEQMAKDFYASCMNQDVLETLSYDPLFGLFESNAELNIPMFSKNYDVETLDPQLVTEELLTNFLLDTNIFGIDVSRNLKHAQNETLLVLYQPNLMFSRPYYDVRNPEARQYMQLYLQYLRSVAEELRVFVTNTRFYAIDENAVSQAIGNVLSLEVSIGSILDETIDINDDLDIVTLAEFETLLKSNESKNINVFKAVQSCLKKLLGQELTSDSKIILHNRPFFTNLTHVLNSVSKEDLTNYLLFGQLLKLAPYSTQRMQFLKAQFEATVGLPSSMRGSRMGFCIDKSILYFGAKVSQLFSMHFHGDATKKATQSLIEDLRSSLAQLIKEAGWMDEDTRGKALEKLAKIKATDAFGQNMSAQAVAKVYEGFEHDILPDDFLMNVVKMNIFWSKKEMARMMAKPTYEDDIHALGFDTSLVNAMYVPPENSIWIPLGIQMPPFYQSDRVQSLNYGAIGMVLGHELTHGFDNSGSLFDKFGNFKNWWSNKTHQQFVQRQQCFIEQYNQFDFPVLESIPDYKGPTGVNGKATLGENIADNGGLREAYMAYQKYLEKQAQELNVTVYEEPALPGLSAFTNDQMFFIGFAHGWCEVKTIGSLINQLETDVHPPAMARVLVSLKNNEDFHAAFQCQKNDEMVAQNPCRVW